MRSGLIGDDVADANASCDGVIASNVSDVGLLRQVTCDAGHGGSFHDDGECGTPSVSINYKMPGLTAVAVALVTVIVFTAFGNILVGIALFRFRALRSVSNLLIGNLALSDFLLAVTVLPLSTVNECLGHWVFGRATCNIWLVVDVLCCTASIWNLCMIALDRFTATFYPLWYRGEGRRHGGRHAAVCSLIVWAIAAAACLPPLLGWNDLASNYVETTVSFQPTSVVDRPGNDATDDREDHGWTGACGTMTVVYRCILFRSPSYVLYSASVSFFIPCLVTLALYANILCALRRRRTKSSSSSSTASGRRNPSVDRYSPASNAASSKTAVRCRRQKLGSSPTPSCDDDDDVSAVTGPLSDVFSPVDDVTDGGLSIVDPRRSSSTNLNRTGSSGRQRRQHWNPHVSECPTSSSSSFRGAAVVSDCVDNDVRKLSPLAPPGGTTASGNRRKRLQQQKQQRQQQTQQRHGDVVRQSSVEFVDNSGIDGPSLGINESTMASEMSRRDVVDQDGADKKITGDLRCEEAASVDERSTFLQVPAVSGKQQCRRTSVFETFQQLAAGLHGSIREHRRRRASSSEQLETRATIRTAVIVAVLCGTWLGFFTIYVVDGWCQWCQVPRRLYAFFFWLGYVNSAVNPILYTVFNNDFRRAFRKILCRSVGRRSTFQTSTAAGRSKRTKSKHRRSPTAGPHVAAEAPITAAEQLANSDMQLR